MLTCPQCGTANPDDARFCMNCGLSLTRACANCSTALPLAARFCSNCGQPQPDPSTPKPASAPIVGEAQAFSPQDLIALGRTDEALLSLAAAEKTAIDIGSRRSLWEIQAVQAEMAAAQGKLDEAEDYRRQAWQVVEQMADTLDSPDRRVIFKQELGARRPAIRLPHPR